MEEKVNTDIHFNQPLPFSLDLLVHYENFETNREPVSYPWVEWFDHYPPPSPVTLPAIQTNFRGHKPQKDLLIWKTPSDEESHRHHLRQLHKLPVIKQRNPPVVVKTKRKKLQSL